MSPNFTSPKATFQRLYVQDVEIEVNGEMKPMKKKSYTRGKSFSLDKDIGTMHYDGEPKRQREDEIDKSHHY